MLLKAQTEDYVVTSLAGGDLGCRRRRAPGP